MALLVRSIILRTSLATINDPIFACFAKKMMTLSLATLILILAVEAFVTVRDMNYPIIRCKSSADKCDARLPTMNFSRFNASI